MLDYILWCLVSLTFRLLQLLKSCPTQSYLFKPYPKLSHVEKLPNVHKRTGPIGDLRRHETKLKCGPALPEPWWESSWRNTDTFWRVYLSWLADRLAGRLTGRLAGWLWVNGAVLFIRPREWCRRWLLRRCLAVLAILLGRLCSLSICWLKVFLSCNEKDSCQNILAFDVGT